MAPRCSLARGVLLALGPQDPAQGKRERGDAAADLGRSAGGEEKPPPGVLKGHQATVAAASFSADGRRVLTISYDKTARVWDSTSAALLFTLQGHRDSITSAAFSPDERRMVTSSQDGTARLWDAGDGHLIHKLEGHKDTVDLATWSPDGLRIVTASRDSTVRTWDSERGLLLLQIKGHEGPVRVATWSPDGRRILTAKEPCPIGPAAPWTAVDDSPSPVQCSRAHR